MAHEDRLIVRCTGERSQTAPQGSVQSDSDREGERRFHRRVVGGNRRCQRLCIRVRLYVQPEPPALSNLDLVIELWKSLGACLNSHCSILSESDSSLGYEQVFSPLEYRSDAASAAECAGLCAERPCLAVYR